MNKCCGQVLWTSVVPKCFRSDVGKCCGEVLWRGVVGVL